MDFNYLRLFDRHASAVAAATAAELRGGDLLQKFSLGRHGSLSVCYAPFDFVASDARLVGRRYYTRPNTGDQRAHRSVGGTESG